MFSQNLAAAAYERRRSFGFHVLPLVPLLVLFLVISAYAEEKPAKPVKDAPRAVEVHATPVAVDHEGTDTPGTRLTFLLKELCNTSSLFVLTDKDTPKINILISSVPEFPSRPEIGSAYAVVWVYAETTIACPCSI